MPPKRTSSSANIISALTLTRECSASAIASCRASYACADVAVLLQVAQSIAKNILLASQAIAATAPKAHYATPCLVSIIGPRWDGSPFNAPPLFWWKGAGEVDITKMLALFCSKEYSGEKAPLRRKCLLESLKKVLPDNAMPEWTDEMVANMEVLAEKTFSDPTAKTTPPPRLKGEPKEPGYRIDLLFRSPATGEKKAEFCYAIEAKFDATLDNDLDTYAKYVGSCYEGKAPPAAKLLVILGLNDDRKNKKSEKQNNKATDNPNNQFHFVSWWKLLPIWEKEIQSQGDLDENFSRFRMTIWSKIGGLDAVAQNIPSS